MVSSDDLAYHEKKYYLINEFRERLLHPILRDRAISYARSSRANVVLFEDDTLGHALAAEMKGAGFSVISVTPQGSKTMRMQVQSTKFRDGRVLFRKKPVFCRKRKPSC